MEVRKVGLDFEKYQHALCTTFTSSLAGRSLKVFERSESTASICCSLPLHAMLPIPSDDMRLPTLPSDISPIYTFLRIHHHFLLSLSRTARIRQRSIDPLCFLLPNHVSLSRVCRETFRLWMKSTSRLRVLSQRGDDRRQNGR